MKTIISKSAAKPLTVAAKEKIKALQVKKRELEAKHKEAMSALVKKHKEAISKIEANLKALGYKKPVKKPTLKELNEAELKRRSKLPMGAGRIPTPKK